MENKPFNAMETNKPENQENDYLNVPASLITSSDGSSLTSGPDSPHSTGEEPMFFNEAEHPDPSAYLTNKFTSISVEAMKNKNQTAGEQPGLSLSSSSSSGDWPTSNHVSRSTSIPFHSAYLSEIPRLDDKVLGDLDAQSRKLSDQLYHMLALLRNSLYKMSGLSLDCMQAYNKSVDLTADSMDTSIRLMYALMARCEELSISMKPISRIRTEINEIKRVLDRMEPVILKELKE